MAKPKTIYTLKGIFSNFLEDIEKKNFMIPAYQRGYKWTSSGRNSQVELLMVDLFTAFESQRDRYYLQFLTLKIKDDALEVIDGQQRLTTLTILFCVLNYNDKNISEDNFVKNKLNYQVRENFIQKYIYENISLILETNHWDEFVKIHSEHDNQDVYFIYNAALSIYKFIKNKILPNQYKNFHDYICEKIFLIVNLLENDVNSEKIFINANRGVKLQDEDLVKGLLITKIPLDNQSRDYRMTENEINEVRTNIGRQWDDIYRWASRDDIRNFFKIDNNYYGLEWLIELAYPIEENGELNPIFNNLENLHRTKKIIATEIFRNIRKTMLTLNDWYSEPELCNLLGYSLHAGKSKGIQSIWKDLHSVTSKVELLQRLKKITMVLLPIDTKKKLLELNYEDSKLELFNLFLMLDVAKFLPIGNRKVARYDFGKILSEDWSIEHIFPQNLGDLKKLKILREVDLNLLRELMPKEFKDLTIEDGDKKKVLQKLFNKIQKDKECKIEDEERELLNYLLEKNTGDLHKIGNLALLEKGMNSGLSNNFFNEKRKIIVRKISLGEFVPFHSYDVFSKLIIEADTSLHVWSKGDIVKHEAYIIKQIQDVINYLNS